MLKISFSLILIFIICSQGKKIVEIEADVEKVSSNKLGLVIISSLQEQLLQGKYPDEIMDILNELDGDLYSDSIQEQQRHDDLVNKCIEDAADLKRIQEELKIEVEKKQAREEKYDQQIAYLQFQSDDKKKELDQIQKMIQTVNSNKIQIKVPYDTLANNMNEVQDLLEKCLQSIKKLQRSSIDDNEAESKNIVSELMSVVKSKSKIEYAHITLAQSQMKLLEHYPYDKDVLDKMVTIFTNLKKNIEQSQENFNNIYDQRMVIYKEKLERYNNSIKNGEQDDSQIQDYISFLRIQIDELNTKFTQNQKAINDRQFDLNTLDNHCKEGMGVFELKKKERNIQLSMIKLLKSDFEDNYDETAREIKKIRITQFSINL